MEYIGVSIMMCSQPQGIKPKMTGDKLRTGVYWKGVLEQKNA
jgi:hypothetical protein